MAAPFFSGIELKKLGSHRNHWELSKNGRMGGIFLSSNGVKDLMSPLSKLQLFGEYIQFVSTLMGNDGECGHQSTVV